MNNVACSGVDKFEKINKDIFEIGGEESPVKELFHKEDESSIQSVSVYMESERYLVVQNCEGVKTNTVVTSMTCTSATGSLNDAVTYSEITLPTGPVNVLTCNPIK